VNAFAMTAIFMVWNESGFALAADESLSITETDNQGLDKTLWTDTAEKIIEIVGHKIAVATAGLGRINLIPINAILEKWSATLSEPLSRTDDYVLNFLEFYKNAGLPNSNTFEYALTTRIRAILHTFKDEFENNPENLLSYISEMINFWRGNEPINIYGDELLEYVKNSFPEDRSEDSEHLRWCKFMDEWAQNRSEINDPKGMTALYRDQIETIFKEVFEFELDMSVEWHESIMQLLVPYLFNYPDAEGVANLLFVGYGKEDWIPSAVKLNLRPHASNSPRATVVKVTSPEFVWYEELAQKEQVDMFLRGIDGEYKNELIQTIPLEEQGEFKDRLFEIEKNRFTKMNAKVSNLSISKLEFVARSFVEMESLGSFLVEFLPSVGGNIKVVSMTR